MLRRKYREKYYFFSFRFMPTSLSSIVHNLSEKLQSDKCKDCKSELDYMLVFNKESIKIFASTYEFCNGDINKYILLLRKGVYPYEYMDSWERFNETSLPDKKNFLQRIKFRRYY